jgi:hypothetical protein
LLGVITAIAFSALGVTIALVRGDRVALPGAVVSLATYLVLGYLAVRGQQWARWVFFTLIVLTTLTCTFFTFIHLQGGKAQVTFTPVLAVVSALYAAIAAAVAFPRGRKPA